MKTFTLLFVVVTMTIALTAGAMASPEQDLIQCVSWNGTYSLMNLYTAFNKTNPSGQTLTPVPGTNPEELVAYNLCGMCTWSDCLRGTHVGLVNAQDSSCKSLANNLGVFVESERGFTLQFPAVSIKFECNLGAGVGAPVIADNTTPYVLTWQSKYVCPNQ